MKVAAGGRVEYWRFFPSGAKVIGQRVRIPRGFDVLALGEALAMSRKKISTTIYVTPEQNEKLKLLHERTKVPVAVYIREGIDLVLRHYNHLLPGQLALDTGRTRQDRESSSAVGSPDGAQKTGAGVPRTERPERTEKAVERLSSSKLEARDLEGDEKAAAAAKT